MGFERSGIKAFEGEIIFWEMLQKMIKQLILNLVPFKYHNLKQFLKRIIMKSMY